MHNIYRSQRPNARDLCTCMYKPMHKKSMQIINLLPSLLFKTNNAKTFHHLENKYSEVNCNSSAQHSDVYLATGNVNTESYATSMETLPSAH